MATLRTTPPTIGSAAELMAVAHAMEAEAARRYRELAARMRLRGETRLAELFDFLAGIELKHAARIDERAVDTTGQPAPALPIRWEVPETFDEEEGESRLLTPYRALAIAVRNEDKAFAFYSYVAAEAPDEAMRRLAEELARDELEHAFLLRMERRKVYRSDPASRGRPAGAGIPEEIGEFWSAIAPAEEHAARYHRSLAAALEGAGQRAAGLFALAAADEEACARAALGETGAAPAALPDEPTMEGGLRLLEEAFERYADIAERTRSEAVMRQAQTLAERTVRHLSLIRGARPAEAAGRH